MKYIVRTRLLSPKMEVASATEKFTIKHKLFSYNAEMLDQYGNVLAKTKRTSWWTMKFKLVLGSDVYDFSLGLSQAELKTPDGKRFNSYDWARLHLEGQVVAEFDKPDTMMKPSEYTLNINESINERALLMAACLNLKRNYIDQSG